MALRSISRPWACCSYGTVAPAHQGEIIKTLGKVEDAPPPDELALAMMRCPMWLGDPGPFRARFGLSAKQAQYFQCTAEHLEARRDGGLNVSANIAAACWHCNQARHRTTRPLAPAEFGQRAQRRASKGGWFSGGLAARVM